MVAKVMLTSAGFALSKEFDYNVPKHLQDKDQIGMRVIVPFGLRNASQEGIIMHLTEKSEYDKLKDIKGFSDDEPVCTKKQLELCTWIQKKYLCSFSQAYKLIRPTRMSSKIHQWLIIQRVAENADGLTSVQRRIVDELEERGGTAEYAEIKECIGGRGLKSAAYALADIGVIQICESISEAVGVRYIRKARLECTIDEGYEMADILLNKWAHIQANMLLALADCGDMSCADLVNMVDGNYSALNSLCGKGLVSIYKEQYVREAYDENKYQVSKAYVPTEEQKPVIDYIDNILDNKTHE